MKPDQYPRLDKKPAPTQVSSGQGQIFLKEQFWVCCSIWVTEEFKCQIRTSQR